MKEILTLYDKKCGGDDAGHNVGGHTLVCAIVVLIQVHNCQVASILYPLPILRECTITLKQNNTD